MNGWTDGCLAPSAVSKLKWWSGCLQRDGAAHTGCVENVWTVCKTKACAEHALTEERVTAAAELCSHDSLQIPLTDRVPNGVKVSECIALNLHPSLSVTLCFSFFSPSTWIPVGYWSILHPFHWRLFSHCISCGLHFSPAAASQWKSRQSCQWPLRWSK